MTSEVDPAALALAVTAAIKSGDARPIDVRRCPQGCRTAGVYRIRGQYVYATFDSRRGGQAFTQWPGLTTVLCKKHHAAVEVDFR